MNNKQRKSRLRRIHSMPKILAEKRRLEEERHRQWCEEQAEAARARIRAAEEAARLEEERRLAMNRPVTQPETVW